MLNPATLDAAWLRRAEDLCSGDCQLRLSPGRRIVHAAQSQDFAGFAAAGQEDSGCPVGRITLSEINLAELLLGAGPRYRPMRACMANVRPTSDGSAHEVSCSRSSTAKVAAYRTLAHDPSITWISETARASSRAVAAESTMFYASAPLAVTILLLIASVPRSVPWRLSDAALPPRLTVIGIRAERSGASSLSPNWASSQANGRKSLARRSGLGSRVSERARSHIGCAERQFRPCARLATLLFIERWVRCADGSA